MQSFELKRNKMSLTMTGYLFLTTMKKSHKWVTKILINTLTAKQRSLNVAPLLFKANTITKWTLL